MKRILKRKSQKNRSRLWKFIFPLFIVAFIIFKSESLILTKNIECYTQYGVCPENISSRLTWLLNYPLLRPLPTSRVRADLRQFTEIKSVFMYRRLPQTLVLSIDLRKPIGAIGSQVLGVYAVTDDEGIIIGQSDKLQLPLLIDKQPVRIGDQIPPEKLQAVKIINQLAGIAPGPLVSEMSGSVLTIRILQTTTVILNLTYLPPDWYTTLQVILDRSKILDKMPKVIDLRFSSPTITF